VNELVEDGQKEVEKFKGFFPFTTRADNLNTGSYLRTLGAIRGVIGLLGTGIMLAGFFGAFLPVRGRGNVSR